MYNHHRTHGINEKGHLQFETCNSSAQCRRISARIWVLICGVVWLGSISGCRMMTGIDSRYPKHWPAIKNSVDLCADLSGIYENRGMVTFATKPTANSLLNRFKPELKTNVSAGFKTIKLVCDSDQHLVVEATGVNGLQLTVDIDLLTSTDWQLKADGLYTVSKVASDVSEVGTYRTKSSFRLLLDEAGNLVGEERLSAVALALWVIPSGGVQRYWSQWNRLSE